MRGKETSGGLPMASRCSSLWDQMEGSEHLRQCGTCGLNVYDLSGLQVEDAAQLIAASCQERCPRLHRRADGTIQTQDCPVGVRNAGRRRLLAFVGAAAAVAAPVSLLQVRAPALPTLLRQREFTAATLAHAVNHFVHLGEEAALAALEALTERAEPRFQGGFDLGERMGWLCRVLFRPKEQSTLREPFFGGLVGLPLFGMPLSAWPLYPLAHSGSSYFVLSEGYMVAGCPERPNDYLEYCLSAGIFRTEPVAIPGRGRAIRDAEALRRSEAWRGIQWKGSGPGYSYEVDEEWAWGFIRKQAANIFW